MCAIKTDIRSASNPRLYYVTCISMTVAHLALHTPLWGYYPSKIKMIGVLAVWHPSGKRHCCFCNNPYNSMNLACHFAFCTTAGTIYFFEIPNTQFLPYS